MDSLDVFVFMFCVLESLENKKWLRTVNSTES
jgi:hypothetical protein